ncbi:DUF3999 domain-containing protein [Lysobacter gummosus]|uniref:DUF3999 domain-containing protein n=1 Tax=Lysobacter gummosus TaxID=262324 RepID=A0ABY3XFZ9_9GAMM|nr:DUF3999 domain-containing protein [Lysobacter gummosus]ALN89989.1 hypothetical protein LG3211_1012 [Lysobacter gummosus]UNP30573.1 DUF3999 domain-containing protein [Lysobacter gummosus]
MKRYLMWLAALPLLATAGPRQDYAQQWSLQLSRDDGGAYRVVLDEAVYRQAQSAQLRDVDVIDRSGAVVPASVFAPEQPIARAPQRVMLPWFPLPASPSGSATQGWELVSEVETDGRLRRVEARSTAADTAKLPQTSLLIDASRLRAPILALELEWAPGAALDAAYGVEASDDLDHWRSLGSSGRLVDLQRDGQRLVQRRIVFDAVGEQARYLRLTPQDPKSAAQINAVTAELAGNAASAPMQWRELKGRRVELKDGSIAFEYTLDGRFPIQQADVALPGNHALEWRLESRDNEEQGWYAQAGPWMAYQVAGKGEGDRSAARQLASTVRDRHWRLRANGAVPGEPVLRLGYRPEVVVFLAQGEPPYALVAGSARAARGNSPLAHLIEALRTSRGRDWQPADATLGSAVALAGASALVPAEPERDWYSYMLWAVLVGGALIVAGFAFSLLKSNKPAAP